MVSIAQPRLVLIPGCSPGPHYADGIRIYRLQQNGLREVRESLAMCRMSQENGEIAAADARLFSSAWSFVDACLIPGDPTHTRIDSLARLLTDINNECGHVGLSPDSAQVLDEVGALVGGLQAAFEQVAGRAHR